LEVVIERSLEIVEGRASLIAPIPEALVFAWTTRRRPLQVILEERMPLRQLATDGMPLRAEYGM
jgi:hypothetical protein